MVIQIKQINDEVVVIETYKNKCKFYNKEAQNKKEVLQDE